MDCRNEGCIATPLSSSLSYLYGKIFSECFLNLRGLGCLNVSFFRHPAVSLCKSVLFQWIYDLWNLSIVSYFFCRVLLWDDSSRFPQNFLGATHFRIYKQLLLMGHVTSNCLQWVYCKAAQVTLGSGLQKLVTRCLEITSYDAQSKHCRTERADSVWKEGFAGCHLSWMPWKGDL